MSSYQTQTTKLTPKEQEIHAGVINYLQRVDAHLSTCRDPNCHIRRLA